MGQLVSKCFKSTETVDTSAAAGTSELAGESILEVAPVANAPQDAAPVTSEPQPMTLPDDFPLEFLYQDEDDVPAATSLEHLRADVLATFECPFRSPCSLRGRCPFAHAAPAGFTRSVPSYFCLDALLGSCRRGSADELSRCPLGFHPTVEELTDLDAFHQKLAAAVLLREPASEHPRTASSRAQTQLFAPLPVDNGPEDTKTEFSCPICLDPLPTSGTQLGYLENCAHIFHGVCLLDWQEQRTALDLAAVMDRFDCPECRIESVRLLLWPALFRSPAEKRTTFYTQKSCFGIHVDAEVALAVHQLAQNQFAVVIEGQQFLFQTETKAKKAHEDGQHEQEGPVEV